MTHPSEKKDQTDAKALVNDADTHRDPSASETPKYSLETLRGCDPCGYSWQNRFTVRVVGHLESDLQQCRTKLAEVERERDFQVARVQAALDCNADLNRQFFSKSLKLTDLETRLQHSEAVRAELAEALEKIQRDIPASDQTGSLYVEHFDGDGTPLGIEHVDPIAVVGNIAGIVQRALARHRAAKEAQS